MSKAAKSWYKVKALANSAGEISLYGDIGGFGITTDSFLRDLKALGKVKNLTIRINSDGGDVFTGFAIYNRLQRMGDTHKTVVVDGLAASIASVIAMAGDELVMPKNAMLMIHNPWGVAGGQSDQIISFGEALAQMRDGIITAYADKSGLSETKLGAMMDRETWLSAARAVELGLADKVANPVDMQASAKRLNLARFRNVPAGFGQSQKGSRVMAKNAKAEIFGEDDEDPAAVADTVRAELVKTAKDIRAMVKLAGQPSETADQFISDGLSVAEVLAKLQESDTDDEGDKGNEGKAAKSGKAKGDLINTRKPAAGAGSASSGEGKPLNPVSVWDRFNKRKAVGIGAR